MKILVPIDFYKPSFSAYSYACHLGQVLEAHITLINVIPHGLTNTATEEYDPSNSLEASSRERLVYLTEKYPSEIGVNIPKIETKLHSTFGMPSSSILRYAQEHDIDLIIMGTRDKHNIFDTLLGSTSSSVIKNSKCPVLLIHKNTKYTKPERVVFAYDQKGDLEDAIDDYSEINTRLKAKTDFVHIYKETKSDLSEQNQVILEELFDDKEPPYSFEIKAVQAPDIQQGLKDYCLFNKIDILAMMHRAHGLTSRLFKRSESIKLAQNFHLPVLVFNED